MSYYQDMDLEACREFDAALEEPRQVCKATMLRRALLSVAGLAVFVAGVFVLTREGNEAGSFAARRRLMDDSDGDGEFDVVQLFMSDMLPRYSGQKSWSQHVRSMGTKALEFSKSLMPSGERRRAETGDTVEIGFTDTDMFFVVNVMNYLGQYVCAITSKSTCERPDLDTIPDYIDPQDVTMLLQSLRDSDDGLEEMRRFDDAALGVAHGLVDQGANVAQGELTRLKDNFLLSNVVSGVQVAGALLEAALSVTPFVMVGAMMNMAINLGAQLSENFYTQKEIHDAMLSVAAKVFDMGIYAENSPVLTYLKSFHDAENDVTLRWTKLIVQGPLKVVQGSDQEAIRRFLTGLARSTDSVSEMEDLVIGVHNQFRKAPWETFFLWKDVAQSMVDVDEKDVTAQLVNNQAESAGFGPIIFSSVSNALLSAGMVSSRRASKWAKQTYAHKARTASNKENVNLFKLRQLSENPKAPRKAKMYSRMTAGLSIASAVVQGIGLGFKIAHQDDVVDKLQENINLQKDNLKSYYTALHDAIAAMKVEEAQSVSG